ncbi:MAG: hypothetical protein LUF77_01410, partial [Oscillospiraceae bacterium]|nr:hypothetical protein [Oscillospiraceae bacterium]
YSLLRKDAAAKRMNQKTVTPYQNAVTLAARRKMSKVNNSNELTHRKYIQFHQICKGEDLLCFHSRAKTQS